METDPLKSQLEALTKEFQGLKNTIEKDIPIQNARLQTIEQTLANINDEQTVRKEIQQLEGRLSELKTRLALKQKGIASWPKRLWSWSISHWTFLAFVVSVISIGYVYGKYGISYFESYKTIANTKNSAKYYKETGDVLLLRAEFKKAEDAYQTAVTIDPSYIEARQGIMRTQVVNSVDTYSTDTPLAVEAKLKYLESISKDDYLIPYVRGIIAMHQDKQGEARKLFDESVNKNADFVGNYLQLGYLDLFNADIAKAKQRFNTALTKIPGHPLAIYNLGLCDMVSLDFNSAINTMKPLASLERLEVLLSLGEAYRSTGDVDMAVFHHERGRQLLEDAKLKQGENYGRATLNFLPQESNDQNTPKSFVQAFEVNHYKALINYALSIDYALQSKFSDAEKSFAQGYSADETINGEKDFGCFYLNRSDFVMRNQKTSPAVVRWLSQKRHALDPNETCRFQEKRL